MMDLTPNWELFWREPFVNSTIHRYNRGVYLTVQHIKEVNQMKIFLTQEVTVGLYKKCMEINLPEFKPL